MFYVGFPILSLLYISIFLILYYSKKRINIFENKIVISMMVFNIIGLILELICYSIFLIFKNQDSFIGMFFLKSYVSYIPIFNLLLTGYIFVLTNENVNSDIKSYYNGVLKIFSPLTIILVIITYIAPLHYYNVYPKYYTYGLATDALLIQFAILMPIWIYKCLKFLFNKDNDALKNRVATLFLGILLIGIAGAITQFIDRSVLIITSVHTLALTLIYLTIENPDLKMIAKLKLAVNTAEKANKAKSDFLSSMSHEIRTPLNAIVALSHFNMEYADKMPEEALENTKIILESSNTLLEIVGNVLDMNKIDSNTMNLVEEEYNFKEEVRNVVKEATLKLDKHTTKFIMNIDKNIPNKLLGDKVRVKEIINNLLTNAIKYTEKGKIELSIKCINKKDKCDLIITVKDTGKGIKKEDMQKLFNKFERLDAPMNSSVEGTGLGLAITKSLVEMMNGKIEVESTYNVGSTFTVIIPQGYVKKNIVHKNKKEVNYEKRTKKRKETEE